MIPFIAAIGLVSLGVATRNDPHARSWVLITLGSIMATDEAFEYMLSYPAPQNRRVKLIRWLLAAGSPRSLSPACSYESPRECRHIYCAPQVPWMLRQSHHRKSMSTTYWPYCEMSSIIPVSLRGKLVRDRTAIIPALYKSIFSKCRHKRPGHICANPVTGLK